MITETHTHTGRSLEISETHFVSLVLLTKPKDVPRAEQQKNVTGERTGGLTLHHVELVLISAG